MNSAKFAFLIACSLLLVSGCADLVALNDSIWTDTRAEARQTQDEFDAQKSRIEARAQSGAITWVQAAQSVKALDRSFAGRGTWKFDSDDEEYHAYSIALAERLDRGQITFSQYDAMRTQRFNQI